MRCSCLLCLIFLLVLAGGAPAASRLKDIATLEGVRDNQLIGYGLVVGLNNTGDRRQTVFSTQTLTNLLQQMGVEVNPNLIRVNNVAAVMVTASLPPFARPGMKVDATVAAIGDASNLQGGLLVLTTLRGVDGQPYAVAQGPVVTGGFIAGRAANNQTVNHPTVGRVPAGVIIERPAPAVDLSGGLKVLLRDADFTTASRLASAINKKFGQDQPVATAESSTTVQVLMPPAFAKRTVDFIAALESVSVDTDSVAKVVVNERTGTIVFGNDVRVSPTAILHGNLSIEIQTRFDVSQPKPFSQGETTVVPEVGVGVKEEKARNIILQEGATVEELVRALISIGSTPRDIISILQNLRRAGALQAEIEVI